MLLSISATPKVMYLTLTWSFLNELSPSHTTPTSLCGEDERQFNRFDENQLSIQRALYQWNRHPFRSFSIILCPISLPDLGDEFLVNRMPELISSTPITLGYTISHNSHATHFRALI